MTAADDLLSLLQAASGHLRTIRPAGSVHARRLAELASRLATERLRVAVLGQFKRGKSTFLNALLGHNVVP
ncbi:MAG: dynamin family protein, partial [Stellaceae bacterium]